MSERTEGYVDPFDPSRPRSPASPARPQRQSDSAPIEEATSSTRGSLNLESQGSERPGDPGIDHPRAIAHTIGPPIYDANVGNPTHEKAQDSEGLIAETVFQLPQLIHGPTVMMCALAAIALVLLFLFSQVLDIASRLSVLNTPLQVAGWLLVVVLTTICLGACGRFLIVVSRLRHRPSLSVRRVKRISSTRGNEGAFDEARDVLKAYLRDPIFDSEAACRHLLKQGLSKDDCVRLVKSRTYLLEARPVDGRAWLCEFGEQFQRVLDEAAAARIARARRAVGSGTALTSNKVIESLLVFHQTFLLLTDLCMLYNRRFTGIWSAYLMGWVVVNAYASTTIEDLGDQAGNAASEVVKNSLEAAPVIGNLFGPLGGVAGVFLQQGARYATKAGVEYTANAALVTRLAHQALSLLRPLQD